VVHEGGGAANIMPERTLADLTPREQHGTEEARQCLLPLRG